MFQRLRDFYARHTVTAVIIALWALLVAVGFLIAWLLVGVTQAVSAPSAASAPAQAPGVVTIDGHSIVVPPGSTLVYDSDTTRTGGATNKTTDRNANYIDWSSAASIGTALAENVDWKALLSGPLGWALGAVGLGGGAGGIGLLRLHAAKHQSIGRAQVRNARAAI